MGRDGGNDPPPGPRPAGRRSWAIFTSHAALYRLPRHTVAAACGNWLMSHPEASLALTAPAGGRLAQAKRAVCPLTWGAWGRGWGNRLRANGPQNGGLGRGYRLEARPQGGGVQFPTEPKVHLGGLKVNEVQRLSHLSFSTYIQYKISHCPVAARTPRHRWSQCAQLVSSKLPTFDPQPLTRKAAPNTNSPNFDSFVTAVPARPSQAVQTGYL